MTVQRAGIEIVFDSAIAQRAAKLFNETMAEADDHTEAFGETLGSVDKELVKTARDFNKTLEPMRELRDEVEKSGDALELAFGKKRGGELRATLEAIEDPAERLAKTSELLQRRLNGTPGVIDRINAALAQNAVEAKLARQELGRFGQITRKAGNMAAAGFVAVGTAAAGALVSLGNYVKGGLEKTIAESATLTKQNAELSSSYDDLQQTVAGVVVSEEELSDVLVGGRVMLDNYSWAVQTLGERYEQLPPNIQHANRKMLEATPLVNVLVLGLKGLERAGQAVQTVNTGLAASFGEVGFQIGEARDEVRGFISDLGDLASKAGVNIKQIANVWFDKNDGKKPKRSGGGGGRAPVVVPETKGTLEDFEGGFGALDVEANFTGSFGETFTKDQIALAEALKARHKEMSEAFKSSAEELKASTLDALTSIDDKLREIEEERIGKMADAFEGAFGRVIDVSQSLTDALATGDLTLKKLGATAKDTVGGQLRNLGFDMAREQAGKFAQDLGKMLLSAGLAFDALLTNPLAAIPAAAALIGIGTYLSKTAQSGLADKGGGASADSAAGREIAALGRDLLPERQERGRPMEIVLVMDGERVATGLVPQLNRLTELGHLQAVPGF